MCLDRRVGVALVEEPVLADVIGLRERLVDLAPGEDPLQHDVAAPLAEDERAPGIERLHGRQRADGHEHRRLHFAMRRAERCGARPAVGGLDPKRETHRITIASPYE